MNFQTLLKRSDIVLKKGETIFEALSSLTHLHMSGLRITDLPDLSLFPQAIVAYLYDNRISNIEGINSLSKLEEVQAQNNEIQIFPVFSLPFLKKLDLRHNFISLIDNFGGLNELKELYLSHQNTPKVFFSPNCFQSLQNTLEILEIAGCGIESLEQFYCLSKLKLLNLSKNRIFLFEEAQTMLSQMPNLERLNLSGNPICSSIKYRDRIIIMGNFVELDEKLIPESQRIALLRLKSRKFNKSNPTIVDHTESPIQIKHLF